MCDGSHGKEQEPLARAGGGEVEFGKGKAPRGQNRPCSAPSLSCVGEATERLPLPPG